MCPIIPYHVYYRQVSTFVFISWTRAKSINAFQFTGLWTLANWKTKIKRSKKKKHRKCHLQAGSICTNYKIAVPYAIRWHGMHVLYFSLYNCFSKTFGCILGWWCYVWKSLGTYIREYPVINEFKYELQKLCNWGLFIGSYILFFMFGKTYYREGGYRVWDLGNLFWGRGLIWKFVTHKLCVFYMLQTTIF